MRTLREIRDTNSDVNKKMQRYFSPQKHGENGGYPLINANISKTT